MLAPEDEDDDYDALNDETFGGDGDIGDWEFEHEQLARQDRPAVGSVGGGHKPVEDLDAIDSFDMFEKSIRNLVIDDDDDEFKDPAIMSLTRSPVKPAGSRPMMSHVPMTHHRVSPQPPPPSIFGDNLPRTDSIWTAYVNEPPKINRTPKKQPTIESPKIMTLEDLEKQMLVKDEVTSTIKRPIKMEELEATLLKEPQEVSSLAGGDRHQLANHELPSSGLESGWSPFGQGSGLVHSIGLPNGRPPGFGSTPGGQVQTIRDLETFDSPRTRSPILERSSLPPAPRAQMTLDELERTLIGSPRGTPPPTSHLTSSPKHSPMSLSQQQQQQLHQLQQQHQRLGNEMPMMLPNLRSPRGMPMGRPAPGLMPNPMNRMLPPQVGNRMPYYMPNHRGPHPHHYPFPLPRQPIMHPLLQPNHKILQIQFQQQQKYLMQRMQFFQQQHHHHRNEDEYAGLMTQYDKDRIVKIHQLQVELKDPYIDDYYYVNFVSKKKLQAAAVDAGDKPAPSLLLPERPKPAPEPPTSNYTPVQFEGSLGKIQVTNVNCPRKLLDCAVNKQTAFESLLGSGDNPDAAKLANRFSSREISRFRKMLLKIERLYVVLLNIDDEDKRIAALPEDGRQQHLDLRQRLCDDLYKGLTKNDKIDLDVVAVKKGLALLFRSLSYLSVPRRVNIIKDLMNATNFQQLVVKPKDRLDYAKILFNAIVTVESSEHVIDIAESISDLKKFLKPDKNDKTETGQKVIETLIRHMETLVLSDSIKDKWRSFGYRILDESEQPTELVALCIEHLAKMGL